MSVIVKIVDTGQVEHLSAPITDLMSSEITAHFVTSSATAF
jgi:hypothetical protein